MTQFTPGQYDDNDENNNEHKPIEDRIAEAKERVEKMDSPEPLDLSDYVGPNTKTIPEDGVLPLSLLVETLAGALEEYGDMPVTMVLGTGGVSSGLPLTLLAVGPAVTRAPHEVEANTSILFVLAPDVEGMLSGGGDLL